MAVRLVAVEMSRALLPVGCSSARALSKKFDMHYIMIVCPSWMDKERCQIRENLFIARGAARRAVVEGSAACHRLPHTLPLRHCH